jgi:hypothetical protein
MVKKQIAAKKQDRMEVAMRHPLQFPFSMMANRFALERDDGFILAHFGLVSKDGFLLDQFKCILPYSALKQQKENLVQYSDAIGLPQKELVAWKVPAQVAPEKREFTIPVVDFVNLTVWDSDNAEICFWNFSQGHLSSLAQSGRLSEFVPYGVAMIRCEANLQRGFLVELYRGEI